MPLRDVLTSREYDKFTTNTNDETAVRIVGEVEVTSGNNGGTKWLQSFIGTTVPATETSGISFTVTATTCTIQQLLASCFRPCVIRLKHNSNIIATGRTGPSSYNLALNFSRASVPLGDTIEVTFEGLSGEAASNIEMFLSGTEV